MATGHPERRAVPRGALAPLPQVDDLLVVVEGGYDQEKVREAFEAFRRHALQLQTQLRVLQAAGGSQLEATGHAVRMDALHLIRGAAEFADQLERDAQGAAAGQLRRTQEEIQRRQREVNALEQEVERLRAETEGRRDEILNEARKEARELVRKAKRDATRELQEAESIGARLLEQARHQATELTNSARAEIEQTLEWAHAQAIAITSRAQEGAEQLLSASGLGAKEMAKVVESIVGSADPARAAAPAARGVGRGAAQAKAAEPQASEPESEGNDDAPGSPNAS